MEKDLDNLLKNKDKMIYDNTPVKNKHLKLYDHHLTIIL